MENSSDELKIIYLIENVGCSRSTSDELLYYFCFINKCSGLKTKNLGELIDHLDNHRERWYGWSGFCYSCNAQISDGKTTVFKEILHMNDVRYHKSDSHGIRISIKRSQDEQAAVNVARARRIQSESIPSVYNIKNSLKPWIRSPPKIQDSCKDTLSEPYLDALYKCFAKNCDFFTSSRRGMLNHLENHENGLVSTMDLTDRSSWLECAYCDTITDSCSSLVKHIDGEHSSSSYQCQYCFYRSCSPNNVLFHLEQFHGTLRKSMLICNTEEMFTAENAFSEKYRSKRIFENIRPLRCTDVACKNITYALDYFINHMKSSNVHGFDYRCQFCGSNISISETTKHLLLHNIGVYQCLYCVFGTDDIESIKSHMCNRHPNELLVICVRLLQRNRVLRVEELNSVESIMISKLNEAIDPKIFRRCPLLHSSTIPNSSSPFASNKISRTIDTSNSWSDWHIDILSYDDLEECFMNDDWVEHSETQLPLEDDKIKPEVKGTKSVEEKKGKKSSDNFWKKENPQLSDIVRYICSYCPEYFDDPKKAQQHCSSSHRSSDFMYGVKKIFKCYHCRHCNVFDLLLNHCENKHKNKDFAMVDVINPEQCGLCPHQFCDPLTEIFDHFKGEHNSMDRLKVKPEIELENYLTDELLDKLIAEGKELLSSKKNQIMYRCPQCNEMNSKHDEMVAHMREHFLQLQCKFCDQRFKERAMVREHHKIAHGKEDDNYRHIDVKENLNAYWEMEILFSNCLLLTRRECKNTKFGGIDAVIELLQRMNDKDMEEIRNNTKTKTKFG